ncbi:MAG: hypothetical protein EXR59_05380 [Dehalococcoidia bacterium]|nr:hypothetical protein [Dehalococcoidia bacterium]
MAATLNATWVEYFVDDAVLNVKRIFASKLGVRKGNIVLSETPGHGIMLDAKAVKRSPSINGNRIANLFRLISVRLKQPGATTGRTAWSRPTKIC